jgi:thioredoxin 1
MLDTNLGHVESVEEFRALVDGGGKVVVACGRTGPMCIPVCGVMESLEPKHPDVAFRDMAFDSETAERTIRALPETRVFHGLPFTVYFRDGKVAAATSSTQTRQQVKAILDGPMA